MPQETRNLLGKSILDLPKPAILWGPKRSSEFLEKKMYELNKAVETKQLQTCVGSENGAALGSASFGIERFLLYPPDHHGHLLFNILVGNQIRGQRIVDNAFNRCCSHDSVYRTTLVDGQATNIQKEEGVDINDPRPRRILVFFNCTKSLQFHYALFKHCIIPRIAFFLYNDDVSVRTTNTWGSRYAQLSNKTPLGHNASQISPFADV